MTTPPPTYLLLETMRRTGSLRPVQSVLMPVRSLLVLASLGRGSAIASQRAFRERRQGAHSGSFATAFEGTTAHGNCVALHLPPLPAPGLLDEEHVRVLQEQIEQIDLHPAEVDHMRQLQHHQRVLFTGWRVALRRALERSAAADDASLVSAAPLLPGAFGAPVLPEGWLGSISHTHGLAAAVACARLTSDNGELLPSGVGIDVEASSRAVTSRLCRRCFAEDERARLGHSNELDERADALLRFSLKEALYKAIHPLLPTSISWHSVTVWPDAEGGCHVDASNLEARLEVRLRADAQWQEQSGFYVATASALLLEPPPRPLGSKSGA